MAHASRLGQNLQKHKCDKNIVVEGKDKYQGEGCDLKFTNKTILKRHRVSSHLFDRRKDDSSNKLNQETSYEIHNKLNGDKVCAKKKEIRIDCDECEKTFDRGSLKRHKERVHKGITYGCGVCKQITAFKSGLQRHCRKKIIGFKILLAETFSLFSCLAR